MDQKVTMRGLFFILPILFLAISILPLAGAANTTLAPTVQAPGGSVSLTGTGFIATRAIGIGFGAEVSATTETLVVKSGSGLGPYIVQTAYYPIKPGTFKAQITVTNGVTLTTQAWDNGAGILQSNSALFASGTIDYTSGELVAYYLADQSGYSLTRVANYTHFKYNVTPAVGVTTNTSGSFSTNITVPSEPNGYHNITTIDASGNLATSSLSIDSTVPEGLNIGIVLLSSIVVFIFAKYMRKPIRITK